MKDLHLCNPAFIPLPFDPITPHTLCFLFQLILLQKPHVNPSQKEATELPSPQSLYLSQNCISHRSISHTLLRRTFNRPHIAQSLSHHPVALTLLCRTAHHSITPYFVFPCCFILSCLQSIQDPFILLSTYFVGLTCYDSILLLLSYSIRRRTFTIYSLTISFV